MNILSIILGIIVLIAAFAAIIVVMFWESSLLFTHAPFIPIPKGVLPHIVKALDLQPGQRVYDLGCGEGRVLISCLAKQPDIRCVGMERSWLPWLMARFYARHLPKDSIRLQRCDFLKQDLSGADKIFVYLFPGLMDRLLPKFKTELKPGTRVVSCDFEFKSMQPIEVIDMERPENVLGRKLFVYTF
jgi:precorrin-6B methylase 2